MSSLMTETGGIFPCITAVRASNTRLGSDDMLTEKIQNVDQLYNDVNPE